jgi:hypothetical protein
MAENTRGQTGILDRLSAAETSDRLSIEVIAPHGFLSFQANAFHSETRLRPFLFQRIHGRQFAQDRIPSNSENSILRSLADANNRA